MHTKLDKNAPRWPSRRRYAAWSDLAEGGHFSHVAKLFQGSTGGNVHSLGGL